MSLNVSMPLDDGRGYFFAEAATIGSSDEEVEAAHRHQITEERAQQIRQCMIIAMHQLRDSMPLGRG